MRAQFSTSVGEPEPLLFAAGLDAIKNVVLDASSIPPNADFGGRRLIRAGTFLKKHPTRLGPDGKPKYVRFDGTGSIEGVLALDAEVLAGPGAQDTARGMFYHGCVFRAQNILDYSTHGAAAASTLNTCKFEVAAF